MHLLILSEFSLSGTDAASKWAAVALGIVTVIYIAFIRPFRKGKKKDPLERSAAGQPSPSLAQQRAIERDLSNLLVEYEQMIRQMTAGVDTRAAKLELLIKDADEKTAALQAVLAAADARGTGSREAVATMAAPDAPGAMAPRPPVAALMTPAPPAPADTPDPRHAEVYSLSDEGSTPQEIARRLGRHHGEIELILALRTGTR